jgi:hypothetical protein
MLFSAHYPFIGQLCIAIPTNRSTPYSMLIALTDRTKRLHVGLDTVKSVGTSDGIIEVASSLVTD